jgi:hypothetical protein
MVNVPKQVSVAPVILGVVVWPGVEQFHVKLANVWLAPAPNHEPALGLVNPITEQVEPLFQVASGRPKPFRDAAAIAALHS